MSLFLGLASTFAVAASLPPVGPLRYAVHTIRIDDRPMRLVADGGFGWIVQLLSWREVEPAPGELYWEYPDLVVRAADYYGIKIVFRIDQQPAWARPGRTNGPPSDPTSYADFVARVATRYQGRVPAYLIWNEPNLAHEWGGVMPDPDGYARLLVAAADRIREADPNALVVSAGLAPTNERSDRALDDREFLRRQLAAPGGRAFDVLAAHAYGFGMAPNVPIDTNTGLNFSRVIELRRIMEDAGMSDREVWITETGWTVDPNATVGGPPVTEAMRSEFLVAAFERASREWPWVGMLAVWSLASDEQDDDGQHGFRLAGPNYQPLASWKALAAMPKYAAWSPLRRLFAWRYRL